MRAPYRWRDSMDATMEAGRDMCGGRAFVDGEQGMVVSLVAVAANRNMARTWWHPVRKAPICSPP